MMTLEDFSDLFGTWGEGGVAVMMSRLADAGIKKALWRTGPAGLAYYPSRVRDIQPQPLDLYDEYPPAWTEDEAWSKRRIITRQLFDYRTFDLLAAALRQGKRFGIDVAFWSEITSEAHGSYPPSRFVREHPEFLSVNRERRKFKTHLSWAYPEVRAYKLAVAKEMLDYRPAELVLDFWKGSCDMRDRRLDDDGYWYGGYDDLSVRAFRERTERDPFAIPNSDPEWVQFRADYVTGFMRDLRKLQQERYPGTTITTFDHARGKTFVWWDTSTPWRDPQSGQEYPFSGIAGRSAGCLEGNLEDVATWTRERLCDAVYSCPCFEGEGDKENYPACLNTVLAKVAPPAKKRAFLVCWHLMNEEDILRYAREARDMGVEELLFCEATPLEQNRLWGACRKAVREFGR